MGSRLFSKKALGAELWFNPVTLLADIATDALGLRPEMANDTMGVGMAAYADRNKDKTGLFGLITPMILSINASLALHGMHDMYNVEFFSYNWLQDLNTTAQELAADIKTKGYQNIIFVTHSNGGLFASTVIAQSPGNKKMVEKAIMLAPPLWGTYISLEGMETGSVNLFDGSALLGLADMGYDIFIKPLSKRWVKTWVRNSPNMYQLTAGNEYIQRVPIFYKTAVGMRTINNPADYYALLNNSPNTNSNLVDGNARSLKYLRETVFNEDILGLWEGMDLTLIGCDYGFITATSAIYRQVGTRAIYAGTIYSKAGDWVVPGISMNGDGRFPFVNLPGAQHLLVLNDPRALLTINQIITGGPLSRFLTYESSISQTSSISPAVGMSDMVRVLIMSDDPLEPRLTNLGISINIYDAKGRLVAKANGEAQTGFAKNNFAYQAWNTGEYSTNILTYIPLNGYSMEVFTGSVSRMASNIKVITEGLDPSGAVISRNEYKLTGASLLSGSIFTLNGNKSLKPEPRAGVTLTALSAATYKQNWQFAAKTLTLAKGATATPAVIGPDSSSMERSNYTWTSTNTAVATVSSNGVITALSPGTAIITAAAKDDSYKLESITVAVTFFTN
jgi:pimeloyl-ACP methyl ester carboxylesterase